MKKQLVIISDMEGASELTEIEPVRHGSEQWRSYGRSCLTSDIRAVCDAAVEFGIEEIILYDGHYAGNPEHNVILEQLPPIVRIVDVQDRCFDWRRIRGQTQDDPFGLILVGQHARYSEADGYFAHSIQSPPIKALTFNGLDIAEIGQAVLNFQGVKFLAVAGDEACRREALELSPNVAVIPVKSKPDRWTPSCAETYKLIREGVLNALERREQADAVLSDPPYHFSMELIPGFHYDIPDEFAWKGSFAEQIAYWEAPSVEIGFEIFNFVRAHIKKG